MISSSNISQSINQERIFFDGYASVYGVQDEQNDVIIQGAFHDINSNCNFLLLLEHEQKKIIGVAHVYEQCIGLYACGAIMLHYQYAQHALFAINEGIITHMSIGYKVIKSYKENDIRYIEKAKLYEVSLVTRPANQQAKILTLKGNNRSQSLF